MTIKELERRTGLPRTSIRFYEQEGLLTPERRENNYRDYSEDNVRTLEKIKLLRRLSLDLEAIRRLQAGELSLSRALAGQALALEGDRSDLERYAQVCQELSQAGTTYDDLDPEPWLAALEEKSLPLSRRVDPAEQDSIAAAPYPWRRYFARALDLSLAGILWSALQYLVLHWYWPEFGLMGFADTLVSAWGAWLFLLVLEPILLCTWGYTPGKRLLRLKVRREDGSKLDLERAVIRTAWIPGLRPGHPPPEYPVSGHLLRQVHQRPGDAMGPGTAVRRPARREEAGSGLRGHSPADPHPQPGHCERELASAQPRRPPHPRTGSGKL